jgi:hypothetical protein
MRLALARAFDRLSWAAADIRDHLDPLPLGLPQPEFIAAKPVPADNRIERDLDWSSPAPYPPCENTGLELILEA